MYKRVLRVLISYNLEGLAMKTDMNVYMLKMQFSPEAVGEPAVTQQNVENSFRTALKGTELVMEFSRVSEPDAETGLMAVICSENAANALREKGEDLGIESLVLNEGRTERRQKALALAERDNGVNYVAAIHMVARI